MSLEAITNNPLVKTVLLKQLKKVVEEHGIKLITIIPDADGELKFDVYNEEMKVLTNKDFNALL